MPTLPAPCPRDDAASLASEAHAHQSALADPARRAALLDAIAAHLDAAQPQIIAQAAAESGLTPAELTPEFARMTGTLRLFAGVVRDGAWARPAIDPAPAPGAPPAVGPPHDLRRMLVPLGPVAVFGASNFPLAYGVCGGDTASALAAGCPVVVKEHPAHPATGRLIATTARAAARAAGLPEAVLGYLENPDPADTAPAAALVQHPRMAAVGFTGSFKGGMAIDALARQRPRPIPVFAEMGSVNPVVITASALRERGAAIADALADAILLRFGQQCTCPGLILLQADAGEADALTQRLAARLAAAPPRDMLTPWVRDAYTRRLASCAAAPGVRVLAGDAKPQGRRAAAAALLGCDLRTLRASPVLQEEIFGPAAVVVTGCAEPLADDFLAALTLTLHATDADIASGLASSIFRDAQAGRLIYNGVPTGVRAAWAMVHGGPYPSTNRPDTTAGGPMALERWCRPLCWQNTPDALLPAPLRRTP